MKMLRLIRFLSVLFAVYLILSQSDAEAAILEEKAAAKDEKSNYRPGEIIGPYYQEKVGPVIADLNGDGKDEIIAGEDCGFTVIGDNGQALWRKRVGDDGISEFALPSIGDLDDNGAKEVVLLGSFEEAGELVFYLLIYDGSGNNILKNRLPYDRSFTFFYAPPVLSDMNQDGCMEIIVQAQICDPYEGYIFIMDMYGDELKGIKIPYTSSRGYSYLNINNMTPAVGDINNDNKQEMIVVTAQQAPNITPSMGVVAIDYSGNTLWKSEVQGITLSGKSMVLIGNVTGDATPEVIIRVYPFSQNSQVYVLSGLTGEILSQWAMPAAVCAEPINDIILADLDNDGLLEIVTNFSTLDSNTDGTVMAYDGDGSPISGWEGRTFPHPPIVAPNASCLIAADLNNDGGCEVVITGEGALGVFRNDGTHISTNLTGWDSAPFPAAGDIDGDGKLELVCLSYSEKDYVSRTLAFQGCRAWDMEGDADSAAAWPMYLNNPQHTGCYVTPPIISIELNESWWALNGVKLGELRSNFSGADGPQHKIRNTGNVPVYVDIGYLTCGGVRGAPKPGPSGVGRKPYTFFTIEGVNGQTLPYQPDVNGAYPKQRIGLISVSGEMPLPLTYGAPTQVSQGVNGMSASYEIRAYPQE